MRKRDMVKVAIATTGTAVGLVAIPTAAAAVTFDFSDFSDTSSLTLNGSAIQTDNILRLTADTSSQAGSAFITNPFSITADTSFSTRFDFWLTGDGFGGDGFTFMIQNDPLGNKAVGGAGVGLGYSGISPSLAVEFDTFLNSEIGDPGRFGLFSNDHIGVNTNGSVISLQLVNLAGVFDLDQDGIFTANINYSGSTNRLDVTITNGETTLGELSPTIDLLELVGSQAYFGFSASTGFESNNHDILSWTLDTDATPLPAPTEQTFEFSGTLGEDLLNNFESFNGDSFTGSYSFFTNTPDLNSQPGRGTYALSDLRLTLLDSESGDETDLVFDATTEAFVDLDSYIVRVRPARVNRRRVAPRTSVVAFSSEDFALQTAAVEDPDPQTCTVKFTDPDRVSFVLTYDDTLANPDLPPTGPPQGNLILSETFFEFFQELSGPDDLCLIDRVQVAEAEVTDPNSNPDPEPVPEPGTALGLGLLGLGWGLRKRLARSVKG